MPLLVKHFLKRIYLLLKLPRFCLSTGDLQNTINLLLEELKGINAQIKNAQHIRASVILYWLRQHNKTQLQYMAGHKYIHNTEAYEVQ
jgi:hypothetical protein